MLSRKLAIIHLFTKLNEAFKSTRFSIQKYTAKTMEYGLIEKKKMYTVMVDILTD